LYANASELPAKRYTAGMKQMLAAALTLVACLTLARAAQPPATSPSTAPAPAAVGEKARDFILPTYDDRAVTLMELNADQPLVLVVLRGWVGYQCPICTKQVAALIGGKAQLAQAGARVLLVYPGPQEELKKHAKDFLKQPLPANFDLATDPDLGLVKQYGVRWDAKGETAYPSTFVIDRTGIIRFAKVSTSHGDRATLKQILEALRESR
jgi:peroxiredoxin Q/BCP